VTLNRGAMVEECPEPEGQDAIPGETFNFVPIERLETTEADQHVDVIAIISRLEEPLTYTNKNGKEVTKRVMNLADSSRKSIEATIFGDKAHDGRLQLNQVLAIKGAKVGNWNSKSLTLFSDANFELNPDSQEAHKLMGWWTREGASTGLTCLSVAGSFGGDPANSRRISFSDIEDQALGLNTKPDFFSVNCYITHVLTDKKAMWYIACPTCKKKVTGADEMNLEGSCEKCNRQVTGGRRWIFTARCNDQTGSKFVSFFDEVGVKMFGTTADDMAPVRERSQTEFDQFFMKKSFMRCVMRCSAKSDTYNDEARIKISCSDFVPTDFKAEGRTLLQEIKTMH